MLRQFLRESYRNKCSQPLSFFINWLGLTLGLTAMIVIYLFIMQEVRHDRGIYSDDMTRTIRCDLGDKDMGSVIPNALPGYLANHFPEVESAAKISTENPYIVSPAENPERKIRMQVALADSTVLNVLPFRFIAGSPHEALSDSRKAILSAEAAQKLFSTTDVVGKTVLIDYNTPVVITGVTVSFPTNTTLRFDLLANTNISGALGNSSFSQHDNWGSWSGECYVRLKPDADYLHFAERYPQTMKEHMRMLWNIGAEQELNLTPNILPFNDIYTTKPASGFSPAKFVDTDDLAIMGLLAMLIVAIAIINYVNIYTARSTKVIRAMGIKTIMGARRAELISYVIVDSVIITFLSAVSAALLAGLLRPLYPKIIGEPVVFDLTWDMILIIFVAVPLLCGVLCGIFPALALTRMKPLDAMANRNSGKRAMGYVRNGLIVFQFIISIVLIGVTLFINRQMDYMSKLKLGYDRENIVVVEGDNFLGKGYQTFRNRLLRNPQVRNVAIATPSPINASQFQTFRWGQRDDEGLDAYIMRADENILEMFGTRIVEGDTATILSNFRQGKSQVLVNETFAKIIRNATPEFVFPTRNFTGIFSDYQCLSLKSDIPPMAIMPIGAWSGNAYIRIAPGDDLEGMLSFIERTFKAVYPGIVYQWAFLDRQFDDMYQSEKLFRARLTTFSLLAIFIGCLGLFALVGYSVEHRRKEIAIRKVYGSTTGEILTLLCRSFFRWLILSAVIAIPLIGYICSKWVAGYAHQAPLSWWIFTAAALVTFLVALITMLGQAYAAATTNPAKATAKD